MSFDAAEKLVDDYAELHEAADSVRGVVTVNRRATELVQATHPCDGSVTNVRGFVACPLSAMISDAFSMAAYRPMPSAIPPEKVVENQRDMSTGAYLLVPEQISGRSRKDTMTTTPDDSGWLAQYPRVVEPRSWSRQTTTGDIIGALLDGRSFDELSTDEMESLAEDYVSRLADEQLREALLRMTFGYLLHQIPEKDWGRVVAQQKQQAGTG